MKSLLIVEDEKLIRQGIRTMVERSGVYIENIYEANNGEAALEILKTNAIEVMFTDIRMPRMDGIELVHHLPQLPYMPYVVAISGFDDFSYAVEMLRGGALEYLLKPIEREKVKQVLTDLEEKLSEDQRAREGGSYEKLLKEGAYGVAFFAEQSEYKVGNNLIRIPGMNMAAGVLLAEDQEKTFLEDYEDVCAGVSSVHRGEDELKYAIKEAGEARTRAFCTEKTISVDTTLPSVPGKLKEHAEGLLSETKRTQRLQMISSEKQKDLIQSWGALFEETRRANLSPELFFEEMSQCMNELRKIYRQVMSEEETEQSRKFESPLIYATISDYEEAVIAFLVDLNKRLLKAQDEEPSQKKMALAISYIRDHYREDMNMATVSNYVSMNYTLFSYSFKQYTGQNFVSYLKEIRLKAARELLENTEDKIIDIAHTVGYDNEKHFLKIFKSELGVSPGEYRKNMQRKDSFPK